MRPSLLASTTYSFDPVPPSAATTPHATTYDDAYFEPVIQRRASGGGGRAGFATAGRRRGQMAGAFDIEGDEGDNSDQDFDAVQAAFMDMLQHEQQRAHEAGAQPEAPESVFRRLTRMLFGAPDEPALDEEEEREENQ